MFLTERELTEKKSRRDAIMKEKDDIMAKTKVHRENPTKESALELKAFITRSAELKTELDQLNIDIAAAEVERSMKDIQVVKSKGDELNMTDNKDLTLRSSQLYRDAFYKKLFRDAGQGFKLTEDEENVIRDVASLNGGSVKTGGDLLLPITTYNKIETILKDRGVIWNLLPKTNFKGAVELPIGSRTGSTKDANGVSQLQYDFTTLTIKQDAIIAEIKVPNILLTNAIEDLENYLALESANYLLEQLDFKVLNGNGDKFDSLLTAATPTHYGDTLTYTHVLEAQGSMKQAYAKGAIWLMNRKTYFTKFRGMTDTQGNLIANTAQVAIGNSRSTQYLVDGIPAEFSDDFADGEFMFFNPFYYRVNVSKNITVNVNASIYENEDKTAWYAKVYAGGKVLFPEEVIKHYKPGTGA